MIPYGDARFPSWFHLEKFAVASGSCKRTSVRAATAMTLPFPAKEPNTSSVSFAAEKKIHVPLIEIVMVMYTVKVMMSDDV